MKIAITGANGFVGTNLCNAMLGAGHLVTALIRSNADTSLIPEAAQQAIIDFSNPDSISRAIANCEVVIHNAGKTRTLTPEEMLAANVGNTNSVIEAVNATPGIKHLIFISSQAASRPSIDGKPISEGSPSAPVTWYGKSKLIAERMIQARCAVNWTILRPVPVYGGGDKDFLALFRSLRGGIGIRLGGRDQIINMLHVSELTAFVQLCIEHQAAAKQVFFVADGNEYTQSGIQRAIAGVMGRPFKEITIPTPLAKGAFILGDLVSHCIGKASVLTKQKMLEIMAPNWNCSINKARQLLGWDPVPRLEEHLLETYQWYKDHSWL